MNLNNRLQTLRQNKRQARQAGNTQRLGRINNRIGNVKSRMNAGAAAGQPTPQPQAQAPGVMGQPDPMQPQKPPPVGGNQLQPEGDPNVVSIQGQQDAQPAAGQAGEIAPTDGNTVTADPAAQQPQQKPLNVGRVKTRIKFLRNKLRNIPDPRQRKKLKKKIQKLKGRLAAGQQPVDDTPIDNGGVEPPPEPEQPLVPTEPAPEPEPEDGYMDTLLPDTQPDPINYEDDALYQWTRDEGLSALEKFNAARGLTGSGHEGEQARRFITDLGARTERYFRGDAQQTADRDQRQADRFYNMLRDESLRNERGEQSQFDNLYKMMGLLAGQSPLQMGYDATKQGSNLAYGYGGDLLSAYSQAYPQNVVPPGGGHVNAPMPSFRPPPPSGPNYQAADANDIFGGAASGSDWGNAIANILPEIVDMFG